MYRQQEEQRSASGEDITAYANVDQSSISSPIY